MDENEWNDRDPAIEASNESSGYDSDLSGTYRIRLRGRLGPGWSNWFYDMDLTEEADDDGRPVTVLTGYLPDQAALHGLLERIRDSVVQILSVDYLEAGLTPGDSDKPTEW